jgi:hypothetical protein
LKIKCVDSRVNVNIFASTSVPFILTTVQVPNIAPTHKKWITVQEVTDDRRRVLEGCRRVHEVQKDTGECERGSGGAEWCRMVQNGAEWCRMVQEANKKVTVK